MKLRTLTIIATIVAVPAFAQEHEHGRVSPVGALSAKPRISSEAAVANPNAASRKNAEEFIGAVERELPIETEYGNRVGWIAANFITPDTDWLSAKVTAELASASVARAKIAAKFDGVDIDPRTRRKLELLKRSLVLPAPEQHIRHALGPRNTFRGGRKATPDSRNRHCCGADVFKEGISSTTRRSVSGPSAPTT